MTRTIGNSSRKAISPAIATVILVAVTLIASVSVGGFIFGIFGTQSKSAQASVTGSSLTPAGVLTATLNNRGGSAVVIETATLTIGTTNWNAPSVSSSGTATFNSSGTTIGIVSVNPGVSTTVYFYQWIGATSNPFSGGQSYTVSLKFSDGSTQTIPTTAQ